MENRQSKQGQGRLLQPWEKGKLQELLRPWLVRWASFLRNRFDVKANQRTAYQDAFDTDYTSLLIPFCETVMFKTPMSKTRRTRGRQQ